MDKNTFQHKFMIKIIFTVALFLTVVTVQNISLNAQSKAPRTKERMNAIKQTKLLEVLGLEENRVEKFLAKYNSFDAKIAENRKKQRKAMQELETAISKKSNDISAKTNNLINLQEEFNKLTVERLREMKSELSEIEYAKFVQFESKFVRELLGSFACERSRRNRGN